MNRSFALLLIAAGLIIAGCQGEPPIADSDKRNADGEVEGKAPQFVLVPAQNDPNNSNKK